MELNTLTKAVLNHLYTISEVEEWQSRLRQWKDRLYLSGESRDNVWPEIAYSLFQGKMESLSVESLGAEIDETLKLLPTLPPVHLTLAYWPPYDHLKDFITWIRQNGAPECVLVIDYNPDLIGGAIINYNGKHFSSTLYARL